MSIIKQTYSNLEILVIDDGSTDNTKTILQRLAQKDSRIRYIKNEENLKLIKTLNKGLDLCNGKYIARMDADDISLLTRIEKQVDFLETHPEIGVVGTYIQIFGVRESVWKMDTKDKYIRAHLFCNSSFAHPSVMMRISILRDNYLYYNTDYPHAEDYKLQCDIAQYTKLANIPEVPLFYRINKEQKETVQRIREEYIAERNVTIRFIAQNTINDIQKLKHYIKERYILDKLLLVWYDSLENEKEIFKRLLTSTHILSLGIKNTSRIFFRKVIKKDNKFVSIIRFNNY